MDVGLGLVACPASAAEPLVGPVVGDGDGPGGGVPADDGPVGVGDGDPEEVGLGVDVGEADGLGDGVGVAVCDGCDFAVEVLQLCVAAGVGDVLPCAAADELICLSVLVWGRGGPPPC